MAARFTPVIASGSPGNGRAVKVTATSTPGTLLHTATNTAGEFDEIVIYALNIDTVTRTLTVEFGSTTAPDDNIAVGIPPLAGLQVVVPGRRLNGGVAVRAFSSAANVMMCHIDVTRYTPAS